MRIAALGALCAAGFLHLGCGADRTAQQRLDGPAVWLEADAPTEVLREVAMAVPRMRTAYIPAGNIGRDGSVERPERFAKAPGSLAVHLVLRGQLLASMPDTWPQVLASSVGGLRLDLQNRGQQVKGALFWFDGLALTDAEVDVLRAIRDALDEELAVGLYLPDTLDSTRAADFARELYDYGVVEFYGQPWDEGDDADRWEITRALPRLEALSAADVPLRAIVRGTGRLSSGPTPLASQLPRQVIAAAAGSVDGSFQFEGYDRQMFSFEAAAGLEIPGIGPLPRSVTLEVMRPTAQHLARVAEAVQRVADERASGQDPESRADVGPYLLVANFSSEEDGLSLAWQQLPQIFAGQSELAPKIELEVELAPGGRELVVAIENTGGPTAVGQLRHNFVEVEVRNGVISRVDPGGFVRYSLGGEAPGSRREMRLGSATILRLSMPLFESQSTVTSGRIRVQGARPSISVEAKFLDPLGDPVPSASWNWPPNDNGSS